MENKKNLCFIVTQTNYHHMPIPNVATLYQKISKGSEGGNEFARFIKLLLMAEFSSQNIDFISESDSSGDFKKVDGYIPGSIDFPAFIKGFQYKFYPNNLSSNQKSEIIKSIEGAIEENEYIQEFVLITPEDFQKEQLDWLHILKDKYEKSYWVESNGLHRKCKFKISHWGHSKIIELALKHDFIGCYYFPELYPYGVGKFKLSSASIDTDSCHWKQFEHNKNGYYQYVILGVENDKITDPIFDFQFKNSSSEIQLLKSVEIHIEELRTLLKGLQPDKLLKSIGVLEYEVNFSEPINIFELADPLIFDANKPLRFRIQLKNFNCTGNWTQLKFLFCFDNFSIPSDSIILSL